MAAFSNAGGTAVGPDGTVTVVVHNDDGGHAAIEAAVKPPGQPFQPPVTLAGLNASYVSRPVTVGDRAGNVVVMWTDVVGDTSVVRAASKPAGGEFGPAQDISDTGSNVSRPSVAIAGGWIVLAWMQDHRVRVATAVAGGPFAVQHPLTPALDVDGRPAVAVAPSGAAVVAWQNYGDTHVKVQAAARATGATSFAPLPDVGSAPRNPGISFYSVRAAMSVNGRATLAWTYHSTAAGGNVIESASRGTTGAFGPAGVVTSKGDSDVALVMSDDDTALLAWLDNTTVSSALRPFGSGFGAPQKIASSVANPSRGVRAAFAADGSVRLLWSGGVGSVYSAFSTRITPDGANDGPEAISPDTPPYNRDQIALAVNDGGDAVASWSAPRRCRSRPRLRHAPPHPHLDPRRHSTGDQRDAGPQPARRAHAAAHSGHDG